MSYITLENSKSNQALFGVLLLIMLKKFQIQICKEIGQHCSTF